MFVSMDSPRARKIEWTTAEECCEEAEALKQAGEFQEAVALYRQGLGYPLGEIERSKICVSLGWDLFSIFRSSEEALPLAQTATSLLDGEPEKSELLAWRGLALGLLAHCLFPRDERSAARTCRLALDFLRRAIEEPVNGPQLAYLHYNAAHLHLLLGDHTAAVEECKECLRRRPDPAYEVSCLGLLGQSYRVAGRFGDATKALTDAISQHAANPHLLMMLYYELAQVQIAIGSFEEARGALREALALIETHPTLHNNATVRADLLLTFAGVHCALGSYRDAVHYYEFALMYQPQRIEALLGLGNSRLAMNDFEGARRLYEQVLSSKETLDSERVEATAGLEQALAGLGLACYKAQRYFDAAEAYRAFLAIHRQTDEPRLNALMWLGECLVASSQYREARACYEEVLSAWGASEEAEHARMMLTRLPGERIV
jgi:tetratricopeptide (TPR) repeat protein